jgi:hypothetical protein
MESARRPAVKACQFASNSSLWISAQASINRDCFGGNPPAKRLTGEMAYTAVAP